MNAESLSMIAGAVISFIFRFPGVSDWFDALKPAEKQWIMLGVLLLTASGIAALACVGWGADFGLQLACNRSGFVTMIHALIGAIMANQGVYQLTRRIGE